MKREKKKNLQKITNRFLSSANQAHDLQEQWNTLYAYNWFEYKFR